MTTLQTGVTKTVYQDKNRNVLAGAWSPGGDRIVFGIGGFAAFFDGFDLCFSNRPIGSRTALRWRS